VAINSNVVVLTNEDDMLGVLHHSDDIRVYLGNTLLRTLYVRHAVTRAVVVLSDYDDVEFVVKQDFDSSGADLLKDLVIADATAGTITLALTEAETLSLDVGIYYYEIILINGTSGTEASRETIVQAQLVIDTSLKSS